MWVSLYVLIPLCVMALVGLISLEILARASLRTLLGWVETTDPDYIYTTWYILAIKVYRVKTPHSTWLW
jgi:hypothetical protein